MMAGEIADDSARRIRLLEEALADYVARYGMTDLARRALSPGSRG